MTSERKKFLSEFNRKSPRDRIDIVNKARAPAENWQWLLDVLHRHVDKIAELSYADRMNMKDLQKPELDKESLREKLSGIFRFGMSNYVYVEKFMLPYASELYHKLAAKNPTEFKTLLELMDFEKETIDVKTEHFVSLIRRKKGRQELFYKNAFIVSTVEVFYHRGFIRDNAFLKCSYILKLLGSSEVKDSIPKPLIYFVADFLNSLPSSSKETVRRNFYKFRDKLTTSEEPLEIILSKKTFDFPLNLIPDKLDI